ncbi:MAG: glycosyltransferase [Chloroflexota bacterium]
MSDASPLRVLIASKALVVGIYQRKLEHIAAAGVDLMAVVPPAWRDERGTTKLERAHTKGYRLVTLPLRLNGNFHLHFYAGLGRLVRLFKPDILHIDEEPYNLAAWQMAYHARRHGARTVFFSWQNIYRTYPIPFRWGERWVISRADYALAGTQSAADVWRQKGYQGPLAVIPQFGTDTELFKPLDEILPRREPFVIGYAGRLVEEKGVDLLLRAAAALDGDWRLRILGGGPRIDALITLARDLGIHERVRFDAQIPSVQMPGFYRDLDILVLPSLTRPNWKEQFGRVLVEAMACGVPVIGSDSGAIPGVIGDAGIVVPEGDIDRLTGALRQLRDDFTLRAHLSLLGRERVLNHFTHIQIAQQTVGIYRALSGQPGLNHH